MNATKPTIVLVPGAWHMAAAYVGLTSQLEAAGYKVVGIDLPSVGASTPLDDYKPDIEAIRAAVESASDNDEDVFLFMHSYGSIPAGEAIKGLDKTTRRKDGKRGGVSHMFYCSAFVLAKGACLIDACGGGPLPWFRVSDDEKIVNPANPEEVFYGDLSKEDQQKHIDSLKPQSYRVMFGKTTWEPYRDIPCTFLYCTEDKAIPIDAQRGMVEATSKSVKWETASVDASHSPFLSQTEKTARAVRKAAGETI